MWLHIRTLQCDQDWNHNLISLRALGRHRLPASCLGAPPCTLTCTDLIKLQLQTEERMGDAFKNIEGCPLPTLRVPYPCPSSLSRAFPLAALQRVTPHGRGMKQKQVLTFDGKASDPPKVDQRSYFCSWALPGERGVSNARIGNSVTRLLVNSIEISQAPEGVGRW